MAKPPRPQRPPRAPEERPQPVVRSVRAALEAAAPWKPAPYELADVSAIQGLSRGDATPDQQRRALDWILYGACRLRDEPYRPGGTDGERDTAFALGQANVGRQIAKLMTLPLAALRRTEPLGDPHEPKS